MRYFIELTYDGSAYHGWQRQPNGVSIQSTLEDALHTLLGQPVVVVGAGRTDAGVHARQIFAHIDVNHPLHENFTYRINQFLPKDIAVRHIHHVNDAAHARFDAVARSYEYHLTTTKNPFLVSYAYNFGKNLDMAAMNQAASLLLNHTDFKCFSKSKTDVKTYDCDITHAEWTCKGSDWVFSITANRFLRNMVRAIVGTLIEVGLGKMSLEDFQTVLRSRSRSEAGFSVPAHGLYLMQVVYPNTIFVDHAT
ncbi:MAG: tRNA pseudouridine(38-40) synthase TruA [Flavobacteriaceae bacterium]